jgi:hypothetical protein
MLRIAAAAFLPFPRFAASAVQTYRPPSLAKGPSVLSARQRYLLLHLLQRCPHQERSTSLWVPR